MPSKKTDVPCDTNGLGHLKHCNQRLLIHMIDLVDAETCANENERGCEGASIGLRHCQEAVLIDVRKITGREDTQ